MVAVWALAGCTGDRGTTISPAELERQPLTLDGIGPLRIGMTLDGVKRTLNGARIELFEVPDTGCSMGAPQGAPQGLSLMFQDGRLVRVDVGAPARTPTQAGVHVGDSEANVHNVYPRGIRVEPHPYDETGHYLVCTPRDGAEAKHLLIFETDGKRVTSFRAGLREAVQLIEGCA